MKCCELAMPTRANPNEVSDGLRLRSQIVNSGGHTGISTCCKNVSQEVSDETKSHSAYPGFGIWLNLSSINILQVTFARLRRRARLNRPLDWQPVTEKA